MDIVKKEKIEHDIVVALKCDVCGKEYPVSPSEMETQEFLRIDFTGGFASVFGDGAWVQCDICQHCLKEKLGQFLKVQ